MYKLVSGTKRTEIVINKSRFIGTSFSCASEEEAKEKVKEISKEFSDATHNCYAYIFDSLGNSLKFSDDGEPQGTAGMPILEVIRNKGLVNTGVVVTRYFGGIKLGAGGLVRAYTECAANTLNESKIVEMTESITYKVSIDYSMFKVVSRFLETEVVVDTIYNTGVSVVVISKQNSFNAIKEKLINMTNGTVVIEEIEKGYYGF